MHEIHDFKVTTIDGDDKSLADYCGKVLLIVNTASRCGFAPQEDHRPHRVDAGEA